MRKPEGLQFNSRPSFIAAGRVMGSTRQIVCTLLLEDPKAVGLQDRQLCT